MDAYAIINAGGKQYMVKAGETLALEKIEAADGAKIELGPVLALSDGTTLKLGAPHIDGGKVVATVIRQERADKVVSFKKKRRKGYSRKIGHRQSNTIVKIESIQ